MRLRFAFSLLLVTPWIAPSLVATGNEPSTARPNIVMVFIDDMGWERPTLARILHDNGYATGHFGKWHLGGQRDVDDAPPISAYGFDESLTNFEGMGAKLLPLTLRPGDSQPGKIWADAERLGQPVTWMQRSKITGGFVDAAVPFIDRASKQGKPFYINLWPDDVHGPFWPPVHADPRLLR